MLLHLQRKINCKPEWEGRGVSRLESLPLKMSTSISEPKSAVHSSSDLPPPRDRKVLRSVSPPLSKVPIRKFNNYLALFSALVLAYYAWRVIQWKGEVGGWWNLALGKRPPGNRGTQTPGGDFRGNSQPPSSGKGGDTDVEKRINDLAAALGVPSKDLASAIAAAVHEYVPPASLSSIAAHQSG